MTPEEWDRKAEFIIETLARISVRQDREYEMREERMAEFERTQNHLMLVQSKVAEILRIQSERLDRTDLHLEKADRQLEKADRQLEKADRQLEEILRLQIRNEDFQRNALALLGRILDRLPPQA